MTTLLLVLCGLAVLAAIGVALWGINLVLNALDPDDALDTYRDRPYR